MTYVGITNAQKAKWHNVHACNDGIFNSASGIKINLLAPTPEMFNITDIACGLAKVCRFGGQINRFYSVAQHSVLVARLAPKHLKKVAMLHDASEAYLGDVIKPLKVLLGKAYEEIEERFMAAIFERFGLSITLLQDVKQWDKEMLEREHEAFQVGDVHTWSDWMKKEHNFSIAVWPANYAEVVFKAEHFLLFNKEVIG